MTSFYDRLSTFYDRIAEGAEHSLRVAALDALEVGGGDTVLEIGCGTGQALLTLSAAVGSAGRVVGLDLSSGMLRVAHHRLAALASTTSTSGPVRLIQADLREPPLAKDCLDATFASFTLELLDLEVIERLLVELLAATRSGGRLAAVSLDRREPTTWPVEAYDWLHRHFGNIVDCRPIPLASLVSGAGWTVAQHEELSLYGLPVAIVVAMKPAVDA